MNLTEFPLEQSWLDTDHCLVIEMYCSKFDLYSKSKVRVDTDEVYPYYQSLIDKVH